MAIIQTMSHPQLLACMMEMACSSTGPGRGSEVPWAAAISASVLTYCSAEKLSCAPSCMNSEENGASSPGMMTSHGARFRGPLRAHHPSHDASCRIPLVRACYSFRAKQRKQLQAVGLRVLHSCGQHSSAIAFPGQMTPYSWTISRTIVLATIKTHAHVVMRPI